MAKKNLAGLKFGHWFVIKESGVNKCGQILWECQCDCAKKTVKNVASSTLINGSSKSCGCQIGKANKMFNTYDLSGEYGIGYTNKKEKFYFDLEDYDKIKLFCWRMNDNGYVISQAKNKNIRFHRLILGLDKYDDSKIQVDHIYHKKFDNRKSQLRLVTNQENSFNKKVTGVYFSKEKNKWVANLSLWR